MQRVCMDTIKGLGLEGGTESPLFATNNQWHDFRFVMFAGSTDANWHECEIEIPSFSAVVNFVFSSADKNAWDNSNGKDYHTAVVNALDRDMLAAALLEEMQSSSAEEVAAPCTVICCEYTVTKHSHLCRWQRRRSIAGGWL